MTNLGIPDQLKQLVRSARIERVIRLARALIDRQVVKLAVTVVGAAEFVGRFVADHA